MQCYGGVCAYELTLAAKATSPLSSPRGMELLLANPEAWLALVSKYLEIEDAALSLVCKCRKKLWKQQCRAHSLLVHPPVLFGCDRTSGGCIEAIEQYRSERVIWAKE